MRHETSVLQRKLSKKNCISFQEQYCFISSLLVAYQHSHRWNRLDRYHPKYMAGLELNKHILANFWQKSTTFQWGHNNHGLELPRPCIH